MAVFIVAYNAVTTLTKVLDRIPDEVWRTVEDVYVFDDASKDDTALLGRAYQREKREGQAHIHRHEKNLGYGGNQKWGYRVRDRAGLRRRGAPPRRRPVRARAAARHHRADRRGPGRRGVRLPHA